MGKAGKHKANKLKQQQQQNKQEDTTKKVEVPTTT